LQRNVRFDYTESVEGTVTANGITRPVSFERVGDDLEGRLVITRARKCTVICTVPTGEGATITWTAKRLGSCRECDGRGRRGLPRLNDHGLLNREPAIGRQIQSAPLA